MPGTVARVCNPSVLGGQSVQITGGQEFKTTLVNIANLVSTTKKLARCGGRYL